MKFKKEKKEDKKNKSKAKRMKMKKKQRAQILTSRTDMRVYTNGRLEFAEQSRRNQSMDILYQCSRLYEYLKIESL